MTVQDRSGKGSTYPQCPNRPDIPRSFPFRFCPHASIFLFLSAGKSAGFPRNSTRNSGTLHKLISIDPLQPPFGQPPNPCQNHHQLRRNFVLQPSHHPEKVPHHKMQFQHPSHTPRNIAKRAHMREQSGSFELHNIAKAQGVQKSKYRHNAS